MGELARSNAPAAVETGDTLFDPSLVDLRNALARGALRLAAATPRKEVEPDNIMGFDACRLGYETLREGDRRAQEQLFAFLEEDGGRIVRAPNEDLDTYVSWRSGQRTLPDVQGKDQPVLLAYKVTANATENRLHTSNGVQIITYIVWAPPCEQDGTSKYMPLTGTMQGQVIFPADGIRGRIGPLPPVRSFEDLEAETRQALCQQARREVLEGWVKEYMACLPKPAQEPASPGRPSNAFRLAETKIEHLLWLSPDNETEALDLLTASFEPAVFQGICKLLDKDQMQLAAELERSGRTPLFEWLMTNAAVIQQEVLAAMGNAVSFGFKDAFIQRLAAEQTKVDTLRKFITDFQQRTVGMNHCVPDAAQDLTARHQ